MTRITMNEEIFRRELGIASDVFLPVAQYMINTNGSSHKYYAIWVEMAGTDEPDRWDASFHYAYGKMQLDSYLPRYVRSDTVTEGSHLHSNQLYIIAAAYKARMDGQYSKGYSSIWRAEIELADIRLQEGGRRWRERYALFKGITPIAPPAPAPAPAPSAPIISVDEDDPGFSVTMLF